MVSRFVTCAPLAFADEPVSAENFNCGICQNPTVLVYVQETTDLQRIQIIFTHFFQAHTTASLIALHKENLACLERQSVYAPLIYSASYMLNSLKFYFPSCYTKLKPITAKLSIYLSSIISMCNYICSIYVYM